VSFDLSRPKPAADPGVRERVRQWVLEAFALPDDSFVLVTQLACSEPGCPPLETAIVVDRDGGVSMRTIHKATADISRADILALVNPEERDDE